MTHDVFERFIRLIEFDQSLQPVEKQMAQIKIQIEDVENKLANFVSDYEKECGIVRELRKRVDHEELLMRTYDAQERIARVRLDSAASSKEFQAFKKEHDRCKQIQHEHEELVMTAWNAYETKQKQLLIFEQIFDTKKEELEKELAELRKKMKGLQDDIMQHAEDRKNYMQDVPEEWIGKYTRMKNAIKNPVVGIIAGTCGGCSYLLSNQLLLALGQNKLMQCTSCYRLLYKHYESTDVVA